MPQLISAVILTKNEAAIIERCIRGALAWADEIIVLDSCSTDGTREIAASLGARVLEQPWLGWVPQRQRSIDAAANDWVFVLEADEITDGALAAAICETMAGEPDPRDGYNVVRRDEFFGRLMPNFRNRARQRAFIRMFNRKHSGYGTDQLIHEEVQPARASIALSGVLVHWRNFTFADQMARYVANSSLEVRQAENAGKRAGALQLVFMPPLRFFWAYLAKGAWRQGLSGLVTAGMMANAEFIRWAALWERQNVVSVPNPPEHLLRTPDVIRPFPPAPPKTASSP